MPKRQALWEELQGKMAARRTKIDTNRSKNKTGSSPHEVIVQKLESEPDTMKQPKDI
eukprot:gene13068-14412_t